MNEKLSIYEIYRACRLCGAGAGYKMPIMQSVIGLEAEDVELKHKIKECVQVEVNYNDRMPPLICELCVDKVHDFFEFRRMCQDTNKKTRLRLGLPLQAAPQKTRDAGGNMLDKMETVNVDSDSDAGEALVHRPAAQAKSKPKPKSKECNFKMKIESYQTLSKQKPRSPSPEVIERRELRDRSKRTTRQSSDISLSELQSDVSYSFVAKAKKKPLDASDEMSPPAKKVKFTPELTKLDGSAKPGPMSSKAPPKPPSPLKQDKSKVSPKSKKAEPAPVSQVKVYHAAKGKKTDLPAPAPKSKRPEPPPTPPAKAKRTESTPIPISKAKNRDSLPPASKSRKREGSPPNSSRASPQPQKSYSCTVCDFNNIKAPQGLASHMKIHTPSYTPKVLACNACELWFCSAMEASCHHRQHLKGMPYTCNKCYDDFRTEQDYDLHFSRRQCLATFEAEDARCEECWREFPTYKLLEEHRCAGAASRPAGKCNKCRRSYTLMRYLVAHEMKCSARGKAQPRVDPEVLSRMLPMQVRIVKCDSLLKNARDGHYDVSGVSHRFGIDRNSSYPYLYSMGDNYIKTEPATSEFSHMVAIQDEVKEEYLNSDDANVPWDSDGSEEADDDPGLMNLFKKKPIDTLSNMTLKAIFSPKCLGEVPKKKRKHKPEQTFDSILSIGFHGFNIKKNIDNIIDNLGDESMTSNNDDFESDPVMDQNKIVHTDGAKGDVTGKETSPATDVSENNGQVEDRDKTDDDSDRIRSRLEASDVQSDTKEQSERLDYQVSNTSEATNVTNARNEEPDEVVKSNLQSAAASETEEHYNHGSESTTDVSVNFNDNVIEDNDKNCHLVSKNIVNDKESLANDDKVENSTTQDEESETMEIVNDDESLSVESKVVNSIAEIEESDKTNDNVQTERESDETNKEIVNGEAIDLVSAENEDSEASNVGNEKSLPNNDENDDANTEEDSQSSEVIDYKKTDDSNVEKDDSQSTVVNDNPNSDTVNLDNDTTDTMFSIPKSDSNDRISDKNETRASSTISFSDVFIDNDVIEKRIESDKFNINNLNEDDKRLMEEIDAQIGEESKYGASTHDGTQTDEEKAKNIISESKAVIGENTAVVGENIDKFGENAASIIENLAGVGENEAPGEVFEGNNAPSLVICDNIGFDLTSDEKKEKLLNHLIQKSNEDLRSLDLDTVSDEEFDFDL